MVRATNGEIPVSVGALQLYRLVSSMEPSTVVPLDICGKLDF